MRRARRSANVVTWLASAGTLGKGRTGMRTTGWVMVVVLAALLLAGCGDESSSGAGSGPTDPTTTGSPTASGSSEPTEADERCPYLTAEQVTDALDTPTTETAGSVHACFFDPEGGTGPSVLLSRVDIQIDPTDYAAQSRALCQGDVTDVAAGDEAFACMSGMGPQGQ